MSDERTTAAVQRYLDELAGDSPAEPIVRALLDRAVRRLHLLGATMLHRSYPRLMQPPLNLQAEELLSAVAERLLNALREIRPRNRPCNARFVFPFLALHGQAIPCRAAGFPASSKKGPSGTDFS